MDPSTIDQAQIQHMVAAMAPVIGILGLVFLALLIVPFWFAFKKSGLSPWLSLLVLLPAGTLITLYVLAFARWRVVPMATEYPPYPSQNYPPQQYVQQANYPAATGYTPQPGYPAASPAYPAPPQPAHPPVEPREV